MVLKATRGGRNYAIKAIINEGDETAGDLMSRFRLESEILKRIKHPRVPGFVESFSTADAHYLVMEYVDGLPLSFLLSTGRRFSEDEVKEITRQLLVILNTLHNPPHPRDAIVHRDLRLSNLMLSGDDLYLVDFGLARFMDGRRNMGCPDPLQKKFAPVAGCKAITPQAGDTGTSRQRRIPGARTYRLLRREVSPRSDLFGVGVVAVDLFTNWVDDESLFTERWDRVLPLSQSFKMFISKLLSRDGWATAAEALACLC